MFIVLRKEKSDIADMAGFIHSKKGYSDIKHSDPDINHRSPKIPEILLVSSTQILSVTYSWVMRSCSDCELCANTEHQSIKVN